jgi:hypothetical protein
MEDGIERGRRGKEAENKKQLMYCLSTNPKTAWQNGYKICDEKNYKAESPCAQ